MSSTRSPTSGSLTQRKIKDLNSKVKEDRWSKWSKDLNYVDGLWSFSSGVINKGGRSDNFIDFVKSRDFFFSEQKHIYRFPTTINYNNKKSNECGQAEVNFNDLCSSCYPRKCFAYKSQHLFWVMWSQVTKTCIIVCLNSHLVNVCMFKHCFQQYNTGTC